jgi:succinate-semialdehyde dehydrogenase/glutarate-semialdehyde dehydrogenase
MSQIKEKYEVYPMYIDGAWVGNDHGSFTKVINPATGKVVGAIPIGGTNEAKQAVDAAHKLLKVGQK